MGGNGLYRSRKDRRVVLFLPDANEERLKISYAQLQIGYFKLSRESLIFILDVAFAMSCQ